jgi:hypothetical protein
MNISATTFLSEEEKVFLFNPKKKKNLQRVMGEMKSLVSLIQNATHRIAPK